MLRGGRKETSTFKINFAKISEFVDFSQWQVTEISLRGGWWREGGNCVVMARHIRILLPAPGLVVVAWSHPGPDTDGDVGAGLGSWAARHRFVT